jgi:pSer/pThr/pTyr-binding forkhead associated (FHA) protein
VLNLLSTNGTYVNNKKVTDSLLGDGDRIRFGEAELVFHKPTGAGTVRLGRLRSFGKRLLSLFA